MTIRYLDAFQFFTSCAFVLPVVNLADDRESDALGSSLTSGPNCRDRSDFDSSPPVLEIRSICARKPDRICGIR
jgi:hypothetical protein